MRNNNMSEATNKWRKIFSHLSPDVLATIDAGLRRAENEGRNFFGIVSEDPQLTQAIKRAILTDGVTEIKKMKKEQLFLFKEKWGKIRGKDVELTAILMDGIYQRLEEEKVSQDISRLVEYQWFEWLNLFGELVNVLAESMTSSDPKGRSYEENLRKVIDALPSQPNMKDLVVDLIFALMERALDLYETSSETSCAGLEATLRHAFSERPDILLWMGLAEDMVVEPRAGLLTPPVSSTWRREWGKFEEQREIFAAWAEELAIDRKGDEAVGELMIIVFNEIYRRLVERESLDLSPELDKWFWQTFKRTGQPLTIWDVAKEVLKIVDDDMEEKAHH